jgi:hypothetical protein
MYGMYFMELPYSNLLAFTEPISFGLVDLSIGRTIIKNFNLRST